MACLALFVKYFFSADSYISLSNSASETSTKESVFTQAAYSGIFPFAL